MSVLAGSACGVPCDVDSSSTLVVPIEQECPSLEVAQTILAGDTSGGFFRASALRADDTKSAYRMCWYRGSVSTQACSAESTRSKRVAQAMPSQAQLGAGNDVSSFACDEQGTLLGRAVDENAACPSDSEASLVGIDDIKAVRVCTYAGQRATTCGGGLGPLPFGPK